MVSLCQSISQLITSVFRSITDLRVTMKSMKFSKIISLLFCLYDFCNCAYIFGWMLHNPIPHDLIADQTINTTHSGIKCKNDSDCGTDSQMYCDSHYGRCDYLHEQGVLCRRDGQCRNGLICIFGKCETPSKPGHKGSRCIDDTDCKSNLCCARQHGEKICKSKLQKGHRCFVPLGGLDYSLNELCPCDHGLECLRVKPKHKRSVHSYLGIFLVLKLFFLFYFFMIIERAVTGSQTPIN